MTAKVNKLVASLIQNTLQISSLLGDKGLLESLIQKLQSIKLDYPADFEIKLLQSAKKETANPDSLSNP